MLYTEVTYAVYDQEMLYKAETISLSHTRNADNSSIKTFIKKGLDKDKKKFKIVIIEKTSMSEEDAFRRYVNRLINIDKLWRNG